jgi:hypothetical protein
LQLDTHCQPLGIFIGRRAIRAIPLANFHVVPNGQRFGHRKQAHHVEKQSRNWRLLSTLLTFTRQGMIMMIGSHQLMLVMDTCDINDIL